MTLNIDKFAEHTDDNPELRFSSLVGTQFFVGPLTREQAEIEVNQYFQNTFPALLFKHNDSYYCVYP